MCSKYCNCDYCGYDKELCEYMGDGSPLCGMFVCAEQNCNGSECISYYELYDIYNGD